MRPGQESDAITRRATGIHAGGDADPFQAQALGQAAVAHNAATGKATARRAQ